VPGEEYPYSGVRGSHRIEIKGAGFKPAPANMQQMAIDISKMKLERSASVARKEDQR
jgi:hypothetical protein